MRADMRMDMCMDMCTEIYAGMSMHAFVLPSPPAPPPAAGGAATGGGGGGGLGDGTCLTNGQWCTEKCMRVCV